MSNIRVMSFNTFMTDMPEDQIKNFADPWPHRAAFNVHTIRRYRPDSIGFQELDLGHIPTYRTELPEYEHCIEDAHAPNLGLAIYWNRERLRRLDAGVFWITPKAEIQDVPPGQPYAFATWVLFEAAGGGTVATGDRFLHVNTQFEDGAAGEKSRRETAAALIAQLPTAAGAYPAVVTGDFNCNPWSDAYLDFIDAGYIDTYRAAGNADNAASSTYHGMQGAGYFALDWGSEVFWRVDWVLALDPAAAARGVVARRRRIQTTSCTIARDAAPPVFASDHYPVVTEFRLL